jgi:hypothetical protein
MCFATLLISGPVVYSGKFFPSETCNDNDIQRQSQYGVHKRKKEWMTNLGQLALEDIDLVDGHRCVQETPELITLSNKIFERLGHPILRHEK